jgi:hypothetical protein
MANDVLHHLDDVAADLFDIARMARAPGGRIVTLDGCLRYRAVENSEAPAYPGSVAICVRTQDGYENLADRASRQ